jgi:capsular exopolysaccharide synthesis family protein
MNPLVPVEQDSAKIIDIGAVMNAVRRRIIPIAITMVIVLALTAVSYKLATPRYSAEGQVGIERTNEEIVNAQQDQRLQPLTTDSSSVDTEVTQILSPETLGRVVDRLGLAKNPDFVGTDPVDPTTARNNAIGALTGGLSAKRDGTSYAIDVSFLSTDPVMAAKIVNTVMDEYLNRQQIQKRDERNKEIGLLSSRIASARGELLGAETEVARFRAATNLVDIQNESTNAQQSIAVLNQQLADAQAQQAVAEARNTARSASSAGAGSAVTSPVLQQLRTEEAALSAQQASLSERYGERHPQVIETNEKLRETRRQIASETARVRQSLAAEADVARRRTSSIVSSLGAQKGQLLQGNAASVRLGELERKATTLKSLYEALLERYQQAIARQGTERSAAYIIARAFVPQKPDSPKKIVYGGGGLLAALLAGALVLAGLEMAENGFTTRRQVERALGLPVLASIPDLRTLDRHRIKSPTPATISHHLVEHPGSVFSEAYRSIRTALKVGREEQSVKVVAISSALPGEGKTSTSFSLARSSALAGITTVLVDCDLRRQATSRQMEGAIQYGLADLLRGEATLDQILVRDSASGAFLLPQRPTNADTSYDLIASSAMQHLVERLRERFDLVILDTAPLLAIADSRAIASMADVALLAVRWRKTPAPAVRLALDHLSMADARIGGILMTMVDLKVQRRAGAGDEMRYYNRYSSYYS